MADPAVPSGITISDMLLDNIIQMMEVPLVNTMVDVHSLDPSNLSADALSLQRLDDKQATGMTMADVAKARWLTALEVLEYLDQAAADDYRGYPLMTSPPDTPPSSGRLLVYDPKVVPNYGDDGIEWRDVDASRWMTIDGVLRKVTGGVDSSSLKSGDDMEGVAGEAGGGEAPKGGSQAGTGRSLAGSHTSSSSSSAMLMGATARYLTCASLPSFHRREFRSPDNMVLVHYLDSVRALRVTSELVDRIVVLSADAGAVPPPVNDRPRAGSTAGGCSISGTSSGEFSQLSGKPHLEDTMNILMEMVDGRDAHGTRVAEAVDEQVLKDTIDAAYSAVMKHVAPDEAVGLVDAIEMAMEVNEENYHLGVGMGIGPGLEISGLLDFGGVEIKDLDINQAIDQVLAGGGGVEEDEMKETGSIHKRSVSSSSGSHKGESDSSSGKGTRAKGKAEILEDRILDGMEEALTKHLRERLIGTTESMLDAKGVSLNSGKGLKKAGMREGRAVPLDDIDPVALVEHYKAQASLPLPEIIDVTPEFHVMGYQPVSSSGEAPLKSHKHSIVISTASPIPGLPPYVDRFYSWERFAAFVDFKEDRSESQENDPLVSNICFSRVTPLTPYSYKVEMPRDFPGYSIRHIVVAGILLPKDHRVKRNFAGIELAVKLTIQTEWSAALDVIMTNKEIDAQIKGIRRPILHGPCGGERMQLLTQVSRVNFTMYPPSSLPASLANAMLSTSQPSFIRRVAMTTNERPTNERKQSGVNIDSEVESKRKRENYYEEFMTTPGIEAYMTTSEVDRHRKVRFIERIASAIDTKGSTMQPGHGFTSGSESGSGSSQGSGRKRDDMSEEEIDKLLGGVMVKYVVSCIERCTNREELLSEINWRGYAGLSLLHHACYFNAMELITLLLNNGADVNLSSEEGDLTPLHFAASSGHKSVVEVLIRSGCNPSPVDVNGESPADQARKEGHEEIATMLYERAGVLGRLHEMDLTSNRNSRTSDVLLQTAFKDLSLKDKLGLNLFVDRSDMAPVAFASQTSNVMMSEGDVDDLDDKPFSFISETDREKLREAMSLANEMDMQEMNLVSEHQDVRRYLLQSNYEAITATKEALDKANKKESDILTKASQASKDPSKLQLSRALAMLVLRKNLPEL